VAKKSNTTAWLGIVLSAIAVGLLAGIILVNPNYTPPPEKMNVDPKDVAYDHSRDAIPRVAKAKVTHILLSWKGKGSVKPKDPNRTQEQAKKLAEEIWQKYNAAPDADKDKVWKELQVQYNEDSGNVHNVYDVTPSAGLVQEFKDTALETAVGKVRITMVAPEKLTYGYHVVRRIE
jgi:hypothetical protein